MDGAIQRIQATTTTTTTTPSSLDWQKIYDRAMALASNSKEDYDQLTTGTQPVQIAELQGEQDGTTISEVVVVIGGLVVITLAVDRAINWVYFKAVSYLDKTIRHPNEYQSGWKKTTAHYLKIGLERLWIPLWFKSEQLAVRAIRANIEQEAHQQRLQNLRNEFFDAAMAEMYVRKTNRQIEPFRRFRNT